MEVIKSLAYSDGYYVFIKKEYRETKDEKLIIHTCVIFSKEHNCFKIISRILTKHPIVWNRYRTNYKIIRKFKNKYLLEHTDCLSINTIHFYAMCMKTLISNNIININN